MKMNEMDKWQRDIESARKVQQKKHDVKDLRNAGCYDNGRNHYLDDDGHPRDGIEIPHWFKNLSKAWAAASRIAVAQRRQEKLNDTGTSKNLSSKWNNWADSRVEMLGEECDPRAPKPKVGRPKLPEHLKKRPTKVKRSDEMKQLLLNNGIEVHEDGSIHNETGHYTGWTFQPNGRVKLEGEDPISVHKFLTLI